MPAGSHGAGGSREQQGAVTKQPGPCAQGLRRRRYLAVHGDVKADAVELQQVPVELPLGVPVVGGSSVGDTGCSSESDSSRGEGCPCDTTAGAATCLCTPCVPWQAGTWVMQVPLSLTWLRQQRISVCPAPTQLPVRPAQGQHWCGQPHVPAHRQAVPSTAPVSGNYHGTPVLTDPALGYHVPLSLLLLAEHHSGKCRRTTTAVCSSHSPSIPT